jgi:hypothetical protein
LEITRIWSWDPTGPQIQKICAIEGQQRLTAMLCYGMLVELVVSGSWLLWLVVSREHRIRGISIESKK